ncbi:MAG TPA: serine/threonine-protein kinase [Nocardioidaceae bacterium]|nr:serine/threonine-protein kinase [Nocardioidaceae bacterium]
MNRSTILRRPDREAAPGTEILPGYDVVARLSHGHRLDTYDVYSRERDCRCVLKTVRADRADEEPCRTALTREGTLLRDLSHPHLVRAYEVVEAPRAAVVLETLTGATLAALIEEGPLSVPDAVLLATQLTSVLGYLHHHGWLHLDVKPSNVVVQGGRAVLIDLSLAARPGDGRPHAGTWGYMAPEQSTGRDLSSAADVFGLGATLGEALTGRLPYGEEGRWRKPTDRTPGRAFRRRLDRVPEGLADLVQACVDTDPNRRPTLPDVRAALRGLAEQAHPSTL